MQDGFKSKIVAKVIVSESELIYIIPKYHYSFEYNHPVRFQKILHGLGIDISKPYYRQDGLLHRNRLGKVVLCSRWIGDERLDEEWLTSGYASQEAKDKAKNSRMLDSLYRARGLTEDVQRILEETDKRSSYQEEEELAQQQ